MKNKTIIFWPMIVTPVLGVIGAALRYWLFATGIDEKGLIVTDHPAQLLIWLLTIATALMLVIATWKLKGSPNYKPNFPPSILGVVGLLMAAVATILTVIPKFNDLTDTLKIAGFALGCASIISLLILAWLRFIGKKPIPLYQMILCAFLMVELVLMYRQWSATAQVQNYCFSLLANVCVMLSVYYSATFAASMGNRQMHTLFHLLAVFFCIVSLPKCDEPIYYALMCGFMMLDMCAFESKPKEG